MIFCIFAKLFFSVLGFVLSFLWQDSSPYLQAFFLGILPIWGEVVATKISRFEPACEKRRGWLLGDAVTDILVFLILPSLWFMKIHNFDALLIASNLIFMACGIYRIHRFIKSGVDAQGFFHGLPVTYTGYQWIIFVFLLSYDLKFVVILLLILVSKEMASNKKWVRAIEQ